MVADVVAVNGNGVLEAIHKADPNRFTDYPPSENDYSIALKISLGDFEYFTGGDLTGANAIRDFGDGSAQSYNDIETAVAPRVGDIEVLRASHHGSAHSSNQAFLNSVDPEFTIVSSGSNNYGHPAKDSVHRLEDTSRLFVTTGADTSVWAPSDHIWKLIQDQDIQVAVFDKGARYEIAGISAQSFTDAQEAAQADGPGSAAGPAVSWQEAPNHVNQEVTVEGQIVGVRVLKTVAFLNFSPQYWRDLTVVIMAPNFGAFPADLQTTYLNRMVRVQGTVTLYEGRPQIVITSPAAQVQIQ